MTNLQKRILTAFIILPLSLFFIIKGSYFLIFFLIFILFAGFYELFSSFKRGITIFFLSLILILSLFSIYYLRVSSEDSVLVLYFVIAISISSDIGGYVFGKIFKWKKLTKISPKKTISGVFGSYFFSVICLVVFLNIWTRDFTELFPAFINIRSFLVAIIFSTVAQFGDLTISYFKRLEKIKDTGKILPGHGGIFDRIDGLMFVVILASLLYYLTKIELIQNPQTGTFLWLLL
tara:strand:- start:23 stop:724 length:702 start_codon:yes stop_codon:yes gene_type:complete